ncbi:MAG: hypothetical protein ACI4WM_00850 [Erysipelotrichaceae bacterium]
MEMLSLSMVLAKKYENIDFEKCIREIVMTMHKIICIFPGYASIPE